MDNAKDILRAVNITKSFGQTHALRGASVDIKNGEMLAIMGPSGSGKSTLLHCLAGIFTPDSGEIWFDGQQINNHNDEELALLRRTKFGFVFQFGQLIPELTAADNIAMPLILNRVSRKEAYKQADNWLLRLGLDHLGMRRSGELSGGQAQRVALARALIMHPKVLFADEPTGALDSVASEQVMEIMVQMAREEGTSVILVTHDARIAAYADRSIIVRDGTVAKPANAVEVA